MKLDRASYDPAAVLDFYEQSLSALGALCERTWHDRLEVVAEGRAAELWSTGGALHAVELRFAPAETPTARDADREVFPGCPLTFRLAEALRPSPLVLEKAALRFDLRQQKPPENEVAEKLWRAQFASTNRWRLNGEWKLCSHFSLLALVRCEIQAIDQHWSLHRVAISLPGGEPDDGLARELDYAQVVGDEGIPWPKPDLPAWQAHLAKALEGDLAGSLSAVRSRQENSLKRELERLDEYFEHYEQELDARAKRTGKEEVKQKTAERLAAARAEHERRRADQLLRHQIHIVPHFDALLLVAEPAWRASLLVEQDHKSHSLEAAFVPRARQWWL